MHVSFSLQIRKPLMERKRRERINASLSELARLLTEAKKVKTEKGKSSKMEKADILELTVKYLQSTINNGNSDSNKKPGNESMNEEKYQEGFKECIRAVERVLNKSTSDELRERLLTHLHARLKILKGINKRKEEKQDEKENRLLESEQPFVSSKEIKPDSSNKYTLTLVPTKLPDGGMAFVLSGNSQSLLKDWNILPSSRLEEREGSAYVETIGKENEIHTLEHESIEVDSSTEQFEQQEIEIDRYQQVYSVSNINPLPNSPSQNEINLEPKIYHTLQPLSPQIYYSSSASLPTSSKPQNKSHCPPTPPPSPLTTETQKQPQIRPLQPVSVRREENNYNDMNQPFDLSISRMWRPW